MTVSAELSPSRQQLSAMFHELRENRVVSSGLAQECRLFRFTGGTISRQAWNTGGVTSYLSAVPAAGSTVTHDFERYRALINALDGWQIKVAASPGPRTLRARFAITDEFDHALAEIAHLEVRLEAAMKQSLAAI